MSASSPPPELSVILPAYNEVRSIGRTLDAIQEYLDGRGLRYEILVSADGNDGTRELVAERGTADRRLHVLGSPERGGKGRGIRLAVEQATGDVIGFLDADYKVAIDEIEKLWPWFEQGCDVVFGSRNTDGSRVEVFQKWYRRIGSKSFTIAMHLLVGLWNVGDTQCGFKFFRREVAKDLFSRQQIDGYMFDVEILYLARQAGYRMKEVGICWRDDGDSRLQLVSGNWRNLKDLFRISLARHRQQPRTIRLPEQATASRESAAARQARRAS